MSPRYRAFPSGATWVVVDREDAQTVVTYTSQNTARLVASVLNEAAFFAAPNREAAA